VRLESTPLLILTAALLFVSCGLITYSALSAEDSAAQRLFRRYAHRLDRHSGFLLMSRTGTEVARMQLIVGAPVAAFSLVARSPALTLVAAAILAIPPIVLWKRHEARVAQLERQLDTWLLMLANALKATSSVGEAIASTVALVPKPFSEEVDLLVKEIRLGAPLDRAVTALARRINSTVVSGALSTIIVARRTGGDLPKTLERASAALRESARLEGVLRTKTAEGRGQVLVLASVPFVLCVIISWLDRSWFDPMIHHPLGKGILLSCAAAWILATGWAHHIVKADL
jgi:tight adherence protein B